MKFLITLLVCITGITTAHSQTTLNQRDTNGKKDGKWIIYLDEKWKPVNDSSHAYYSRYTYYDHGVDIYPIGRGKNSFRITAGKINTIKGKPLLLNDDYRWADKEGTTRSTNSYKNGEPVHIQFFYANGKQSRDFDYTKTWKDEPHTYHVIVFDKSGVPSAYFYMRKEKGNAWFLHHCAATE
jgi:hypothetical protein